MPPTCSLLRFTMDGSAVRITYLLAPERRIADIEGGDAVPPLPLLTRLAEALDASLTIDLDGDSSVLAFTAHDNQRPDDATPGGHSPVA
ncbi:hypothetical protein [Streptomyces sp. HUAS ZL42]|uniref:hypothetical protein n=1 Tax=Streptomyces sp. HUAS ZL42 TaxID=3231715 RepID=UPI00345E713E